MRSAFEAMGHDTWSCDLEPNEAGAAKHYQGDVRDILYDSWDMLLAFPECTYLCSSGMHWTTRGLRDPQLTENALDFVRLLMNAPILYKAIENPIGCISSRIRKPNQIIQPNKFGEDASKATCLWLENLPPLESTEEIEGRLVEWPKGSGRFVRRWGNQLDSGQNVLGPSATRWKERSRTYPGIADAMAQQWG